MKEKNVFHSPLLNIFQKKKTEKKESRFSGCDGRTVKVFGKKILPVRWRFFYQNPQGLTLTGRVRWTVGASYFCFPFYCVFGVGFQCVGWGKLIRGFATPLKGGGV